MKALVKRLFAMAGLGVYRVGTSQNSNSHTPVVSSPIHHNSKEGLEEFYSNREAVESYLDPQFYERIIDLGLTFGVGYDEKRIADIGCGTGGLLKALKNRFRPRSLTGFEYSEKAIDIARSQVPNVEFLYFDIYEGSARCFDVIFCVEVLEHLLHPDTALRNIIGMLADSGTLLVTVPNGRMDTFDGHINFWSPESWNVFLKNVCADLSVKTGLIEDGQNNYAVITKSESLVTAN